MPAVDVCSLCLVFAEERGRGRGGKGTQAELRWIVCLGYLCDMGCLQMHFCRPLIPLIDQGRYAAFNMVWRAF